MTMDESVQQAADAEEHRRSYKAIMRFSTQVGVPGALGLAMFFANLVARHGLGVALVAGVATYVIVFFVVKAFFSH